MNDSDIQFGDLEEADYGERRRPDRDGHFAVVPYGKPNEHDLPVFMDMEVLADIELHSQSDASVELGGVLLGGQYVDEQGEPFVMIRDSIRAEAYESSRGHFKFTQETWTRISRRRDQFNEDLHMVGWYHTHPGWGVFLSSMDRFICENFFNRKLDVAYVVDPVASDRGWFYWDPSASDPLPRTGGFYVTTSRFRHDALAGYLQALQGEGSMKGISFESDDDQVARREIVHVFRPQLGWLGAAVFALFAFQCCLMVLLVWLANPTHRPAAVPSTTVAADAATQNDAVAQLLANVRVSEDGQVTFAKMVDENQKLKEQVARLERAEVLLSELTERFQDVREEQAAGRQSLARAQTENQQLSDRVASLKSELAELKRQTTVPTVRAADPAAQPDDTETERNPWVTRVGLGLFVVLILGGIGGPYLLRKFRKPYNYDDEEPIGNLPKNVGGNATAAATPETDGSPEPASEGEPSRNPK